MKSKQVLKIISDVIVINNSINNLIQELKIKDKKYAKN